MLQTNWWTCRQRLSAAVLQTNFVCTGSPDRQNSADKLCLQKIRQNLAKMQTNFVCRKSAKNWPKCRQILQTNFFCKKSAENWAKMQTNPADKPCQDRKLQAAAEKRRQSLSTTFRQGLSILDKLCLYPKILELALKHSSGNASMPARSVAGSAKSACTLGFDL